MGRPRKNSKPEPEAQVSEPSQIEVKVADTNETIVFTRPESMSQQDADAASVLSSSLPAAASQPRRDSVPGTSSALRKQSLSITDIVSLAASRPQQRDGTTPASASSVHSASSTAAIQNLNLPETLKLSLLKADSPTLNALLPLIRQKLAAKNAEVAQRRASIEAEAMNSPAMSSSSRRSSLSSSRTEDHRNSHKIAERKRRREMKDVFDGLRSCLPPGLGKASKWEVLSEAADELDRLSALEAELQIKRDQLLSEIQKKK